MVALELRHLKTNKVEIKIFLKSNDLKKFIKSYEEEKDYAYGTLTNKKNMKYKLLSVSCDKDDECESYLKGLGIIKNKKDYER